jgi:hypothetical protein
MSSPAIHWQRLLTVEILQLHALTPFPAAHRLTNGRGLKWKSKSKSHCDWRSVSKSWCQAPSGAHDQIFITVWQLRSCFHGVPSLTRGRICLLYMLLALASAVFRGSESLGTRDHILLSQFWDFFFVASHDLQGHGGGIRPLLHTGQDVV